MTTLLGALLDASIRVGVIAAVVGLVLILARVRSSGLRHAAWAAVLCAMLLMPVLPNLVPSVAIPVPEKTFQITLPAGMPEPLPDTAPVAASLPAPAPVREAPSTRGPVWPVVVVGVYLAGVLALFSRLLMGWFRLRRLLRTSTQISGQAGPVFESPLLATPLTAGVFTPRVLLPSVWRQWPEEKLRAVLAHETAHVERRDTLTGFLAHLNRCVFWFHPLAWWLERKLAVTAEQACDDAGVRAVGESRKYAEVLLDMAEAVRQSGHRLSFQGVGVDGSGLLGQRIDRILRGGFLRGVSRTRKIVVALSCAIAIFLVAACRQQAKFAALREDPKYAAYLAGVKDHQAIRAITPAQVAGLEAAVQKNPEDLTTRQKLMVFYASVGKQVLGEEKTLAAFRRHKQWLVQHHPDNPTASTVNLVPDAEGDAQTKKLWLAAIEKANAPIAVLDNAASFFEKIDKPLSTKLLERAQTVKPSSYHSRLLGGRYAEIIAGPDGPEAQATRKILAESQDAELLAAAGAGLAFTGKGEIDISKANPGLYDLGKSYVDRALKLAPNSQRVHLDHVSLRRIEQLYRKRTAVGNDPSEAQYQKAAALSESERFQLFPMLAEDAYVRGDSLEYYQHDLPGARAAWELARKYGQDEVKLAPKFRNDPYYGTAIHRTNMVLGMVSMRVDGNKEAATKYMLAASKAPATEELTYEVSYFIRSLPALLLKYGGPAQREAVIESLARLGKFSQPANFWLLESAAQLRQGLMPLWYQSRAAKLK